MEPSPRPTAGPSSSVSTGTGTGVRNRQRNGITAAHESHAGSISSHHHHHSTAGLSGLVVMSSARPTNNHAIADPGSNQQAALQRRRRSSTFSNYSVQEATQDIREEILDPAPAGAGAVPAEKTSWKTCLPVMIALLPPAVGVIFKGGATFCTDALLLGLAAIFLLWSVTAPWKWYRATQQIQVTPGTAGSDGSLNATPSGSESALKEASEAEERANITTATSNHNTTTNPSSGESRAASAAAAAAADARFRLRRLELLALLSCFLAPLAASRLLHFIRLGLSPPSESLLSDFHITVFLMAAEVKPMAHAIKLLLARTLHLQRVVVQAQGGSSSGGGPDGGLEILGVREREERYEELVARLEMVEGRVLPRGKERRRRRREEEGEKEEEGRPRTNGYGDETDDGSPGVYDVDGDIGGEDGGGCYCNDPQRQQRERAALREEARRVAAAAMRSQMDELEDSLHMAFGRYERRVREVRAELDELWAYLDDATGSDGRKRRGLIRTAVGGGLALAMFPWTATYDTVQWLLSDHARADEVDGEDPPWRGVGARSRRQRGGGAWLEGKRKARSASARPASARSYSSPPSKRRR